MPAPPDTVADRLVGDLLDDGVDPAVSHLLMTAAGGDPGLLRALVLTTLGLGELVRSDSPRPRNAPISGVGRLADVIEDRSGAMPDAQLAALRALTQAWIRPYALVAAELEVRWPQGQPELAELTRRQRQVLALLGQGLTVQAIAHRLCLSPRTVGKHLERIYRRLGTSDRLTTVLQARRAGLLSDDGR